MFFIGIDIGKRHHEVALIDGTGNIIGKTICITNTKHWSEKLIDIFNNHNLRLKMLSSISGIFNETARKLVPE